jgi:arylsulfatase A
MKNLFFLFLLYSFTGLECAISGTAPKSNKTPPNVILIMSDDMGYECLSSNGSTSYSTPILDSLAANGIRFTKAISQPLCTPSRVKIMTGKYNYRNYESFSYLNPNQRTFGNVMKDAGYETCIVGKWQLNGLVYKKPGYEDNTRPHHFGFDEYCLWQLTKPRTKDAERFANPLLEQNGEMLPRDEDAYGPDVVSNFAIDFIKRKKDKPFFIYYPMILVHNPFVPTPDSPEWADKENRYNADPRFFKDMMEYTDKIVGRIVNELKAQGIADNTLLIFTGDNGTNVHITSKTKTGSIQGAKGNTIDAGTHVPMLANWPAKIKKGKVYDGLIEFSDFYPTLADIVNRTETADGKSFYNLLIGETQEDRNSAFVHYDPMWSKNVNQYRNQFARTSRYKLYQDGQFYDLFNDQLEKSPISEKEMTKEMKDIRLQLQKVISKAPRWKKEG